MNRWEPRNGGHYCTVHDAEFLLGEVCTACVLEPGAPVGDERPPEDHLEKELRLLEAECHSRAKRMWRSAEELLADKDTSDACKASAEAAKWTRIALEIHERRTQKHELASLIKQYRALLGKDGSN